MGPKKLWLERAKFFLLGVCALIGILFLTGAAENSVPTLNFGRYQIATWGSDLGKGGAFGVFVLDTVSGETKMVYTKLYGSPGKGKTVKNDLNKPFISIK
ncbi:MAG: hypothetical protein KAJ60_06010 [Desulfobulbaceae bacterium]|nr:hypothetical protein [Desulfobulbaceae bacterium]MCK5340608.1 hypothetical protein [Desulfobulbaceae bacterium]MCK5404278.1 hypothetical protein [Desulfobulbaceae bacterium]